MKTIHFFSEDIVFKHMHEETIIQWIKSIIKKHSKLLGDISYIFCSDDYLLKINQEHLNHNYYTDIITFDYTKDEIISGDIFISIDRVKDNAKNFNQEFNQELARVIIHGILHLLGFKDKSKEEAQLMRKKEEEALNLLHY